MEVGINFFMPKNTNYQKSRKPTGDHRSPIHTNSVFKRICKNLYLLPPNILYKKSAERLLSPCGYLYTILIFNMRRLLELFSQLSRFIYQRTNIIVNIGL